MSSNLDGPVRVGQQVYAKSDRDGRWYAATVVQAIEGASVNVKFQATGRMQGCAWGDVRSGGAPPPTTTERKMSNPSLNMSMLGASGTQMPRPAPRQASPRAGPRPQPDLRQTAPSVATSAPAASSWSFTRSPSAAAISPRSGSRPPPPGHSAPNVASTSTFGTVTPSAPVPEKRRGLTIMGGMRGARSPRSQTAAASDPRMVQISGPSVPVMPQLPPQDGSGSPRKLSAPAPMTRNQCPQCMSSFGSKEALVNHLDTSCGRNVTGAPGSMPKPMLRKATLDNSQRQRPPDPSLAPSSATASPARPSPPPAQEQSPRWRLFDAAVPVEGFLQMKSSKGGLGKGWKVYYFVQEGTLLHFSKTQRDGSLGWVDLDELAEVESYTERGVNVISLEVHDGTSYLFRAQNDDVNEFPYWQAAFFHFRDQCQGSQAYLSARDPSPRQREPSPRQRQQKQNVGTSSSPQDSFSFLELLDRDAEEPNFSLTNEESVNSIILDPASPRSFLSLRGKSSPARSPRSPTFTPPYTPRSPTEPLSPLRSFADEESPRKEVPKRGLDDEDEPLVPPLSEESPREESDVDRTESELVVGRGDDDEGGGRQRLSVEARPLSAYSRPGSEYEFSEASVSVEDKVLSSAPPKKSVPRLSAFISAAELHPKLQKMQQQEEEQVVEEAQEDVFEEDPRVNSLKGPPRMPPPVLHDDSDEDTQEMNVTLPAEEELPAPQIDVDDEAAEEDHAVVENDDDDDDDDDVYEDGDEEDSSSWDPPSEEWANDDYEETVALDINPALAKPKPRWGGVNVMGGLDPSAVKLKRISRRSNRKSRRKTTKVEPPKKKVPLPGGGTYEPQEKDEEAKVKKVEDLALQLLKEEEEAAAAAAAEEEERKKREAEEAEREVQLELERQLAAQKAEIDAIQQERRRLEELERVSMMHKESDLEKQRLEIERIQEERKRLEHLERMSMMRREQEQQQEEEEEEVEEEEEKEAEKEEEDVEEEAAPDELECPVCSEMNAPSESFCVECGSKLPEVVAKPKPSPKKVAAKAVPPKKPILKRPKQPPSPMVKKGSLRKLVKGLPPPAKAPPGGGVRSRSRPGSVKKEKERDEDAPEEEIDVPDEAIKKEKKELKLEENLKLRELQALLVQREKEKAEIEKSRQKMEKSLQQQITQYEKSLEELPAEQERLENDAGFEKEELEGQRRVELQKVQKHWRNQLQIALKQEVERVRQAKLAESSQLKAQKEEAEDRLEELQSELSVLKEKHVAQRVRAERVAAEKRLREFEAEVDDARQKRIAYRDQQTFALEEKERQQQVIRDAERAEALAAIDKKKEEGPSASESVIESVIEEVEPVDVEVIKKEMNDAKDAYEDFKAAEALKEESRGKVERGMRENYARKVSALDDQEEERAKQLKLVKEEAGEAVSDEDDDDDAKDDTVEERFQKGDSVLAKRRLQDKQWLPARVEYATSEGKYLVSFLHNKSRTLCGPGQVRSSKTPPPADKLDAPKARKIPKKAVSNRSSQRETVVLKRRSDLDEEGKKIKAARKQAQKERDTALNKLDEERKAAKEEMSRLELAAAKLEEQFLGALGSEKKRLAQTKKKLKKEQKTMRKRFLKDLESQKAEIENLYDQKDFDAREALLAAVALIDEEWEAEEEDYNEQYEEEAEQLEELVAKLREQEVDANAGGDDDDDTEDLEEGDPLQKKTAELDQVKAEIATLTEKYEALETEIAEEQFSVDQEAVERDIAKQRQGEEADVEVRYTKLEAECDGKLSAALADLEKKESELKSSLKQCKAKLRSNADETELQRLELEIAMLRSDFSKKKRIAEERARQKEEEMERKRLEKEHQEEQERLRQKEIEEELERVRQETERVEQERIEQEKRLEAEREQARLEAERLEAERQERRRREEEEERQRQEEEEQRRAEEERLRLEEEAREEALEREREEALQRQEQERIAMEEAEERARVTESQLLEGEGDATDSAIADLLEPPLDDAPMEPAVDQLSDLNARLEELLTDKEELRTAIQAEKDALIEKKNIQRQTRIDRFLALHEEVTASGEDVLATVEREDSSANVSETFDQQLERLFSVASEVVERCCDDPEIAQLVHSLRDMRAAAQLLQGQMEDGDMDAECVDSVRQVGRSLLELSQTALSRAVDGLQSAPVDDVQVDAELTFALDDVNHNIEALRADIVKLMPAKPKRRIKSTAPMKALPTLD